MYLPVGRHLNNGPHLLLRFAVILNYCMIKAYRNSHHMPSQLALDHWGIMTMESAAKAAVISEHYKEY